MKSVKYTAVHIMFETWIEIAKLEHTVSLTGAPARCSLPKFSFLMNRIDTSDASHRGHFRQVPILPDRYSDIYASITPLRFELVGCRGVRANGCLHLCVANYPAHEFP
jgi:hypothetical protein